MNNDQRFMIFPFKITKTNTNPIQKQKKGLPRFIIFENVFDRFKAWIWANILFYFILILARVYLGRENQKIKYPHTKIVEK